MKTRAKVWVVRGVLVATACAATVGGAMAWAVHRANMPPGAVEGVVVDTSGAGLTGCHITRTGTSLYWMDNFIGIFTGNEGGFTVNLHPGGWNLTADCPGHKGRAHVDVRTDRTTRVRIVASRSE